MRKNTVRKVVTLGAVAALLLNAPITSYAATAGSNMLIAPKPSLTTIQEKKVIYYLCDGNDYATKGKRLLRGKQLSLKAVDQDNNLVEDVTWSSSDTDVAVVDNKGNVFTTGKGDALITADNSDYTSTVFKVSVVAPDDKIITPPAEMTTATSTPVPTQAPPVKSPIKIGTTNKNNTSNTYVVTKGKSVDLNIFRDDTVSGTLECHWYSEDPEIAEVSWQGLVKAIKKGTTTIGLKVKDVDSNKEYEVTPVTIIVSEVMFGDIDDITPTDVPSVTVAPTESPNTTVAPTKAPTATSAPIRVPTSNPKPTNVPMNTPISTPTNIPTATPTEIPVVTAAPTLEPTPTPEILTGMAKVMSDNIIQLTFNRPVHYSKSDIEVSTYSYYSDSTPLKVQCLSISDDMLTLTLTLKESLMQGESVRVKVPELDYYLQTSAHFGAPTSAKLVFTSLGEEGVAYSMGEDGQEVLTEVGIKLYCEDVDVTKTYLEMGVLDLNVKGDESDVTVYGNSIAFYKPNVRVRVDGTFTYFVGNSSPVEVPFEGIVITSSAPKEYRVTRVMDWTLADVSINEPIDWDKPVQSMIAEDGNAYKVVALIRDNYGYTYCTDDRGVDESNGIYSIYDTSKPLAYNNHSIVFTETDTKFDITTDGAFYLNSYVKTANIKVKAADANSRERNIGSLNIDIKSPSKLNTISFSTERVAISTDVVSAFDEDVCIEAVSFTLKDQYDNEWRGSCDWMITTNDNGASGCIGAGIYVKDNAVYVNGKMLRGFTKTNNIKITLTDTISKKYGSFTVALNNPAYDRDGIIIADGWAMDDKKVYDISLTDADRLNMCKEIPLDIYLTSKGSVKVGKKTNQIYISDAPNRTFSVEDCYEEDLYVTVTGPSGRMLYDVKDANEIGLRIGSDGRLYMKVAYSTEENPGSFIMAESGNYNVRLAYIKENNGNRVITEKKTISFQMNNPVPKIAFKGIKSTTTDIFVTSEEDVKQIVENCFTFTYNDVLWQDFSKDMITKVQYNVVDNKVTVQSLVLQVPYDSGTAQGVGYKVDLNNIFRSIRIE